MTKETETKCARRGFSPALAAGTTVLGVIPLLPDVFWVAMAVTIMAGLSFGSVLTMFAVPTLYSMFYRVPSPTA